MHETARERTSWFARLLAASIGMTPEAVELLDDLDEECASRVASVGDAAAHRWRMYQAVRAVPYLTRTALQRATWSGVGALTMRAVTALTLLLVIELVVGGIVGGLLDLLGVLDRSPLRPGTGWWFLWMLPLTTIGFSLFGYLSAWLDAARPLRTPLFVALLVFGWTLLSMGQLPGMPTAVVAVYAIWHAVSVLGGGALRLRQAVHLARAAS